MANRRQHAALGVTVGLGGYALYLWMKEEELSWPELIGAGLAGAIGAFLPDILEPADSPNHRSFFHSVSFVGMAVPPAWSWALKIRDQQVRLAEEFELRANSTWDNYDNSIWKLQALLHRFLAGLLPGLILGYASHLAADAVTPKGLPFLM